MSENNHKYLKVKEELNITIEEQLTDCHEITYSDQDTCEENESKNKPEGFCDDGQNVMEYEQVNANGNIQNEEYGRCMGCDEDKRNDEKKMLIKDTMNGKNNANDSNDGYNIMSKSVVIKKELDITIGEEINECYKFTYTESDTEEKEVKNKLVGFCDEVSGQNVMDYEQVKGNGDIKYEGYGEGGWWMGRDKNESNDKEKIENLLVVASVDEPKEVKKSKGKNNGWNSSKNNKKESITLPHCWKPVVSLEDKRFHKHYHHQVSDRLSNVKDNSKKKKGGASSIKHTASSTTILHCSYCDYTTNKKFNLQEHIEHRHVHETVFLCTYCSYETSIKRFLDSHVKAKHSKVMDVYECFYCNYQVNQKLHLIIHINALHAKTTL